MKFSWKSLKISIAGARLSHLVRKDKIWDHGTMVETVRIIFNHVQKARHDGDVEILKKYMTPEGCQQFKKEIELLWNSKKWPAQNPILKDIVIIDVIEGKQNRPDHFTAVLEEIDDIDTNELIGNARNKFSEQWFFVRQGDWWLLDGIKITMPALKW